MDPSKLCFVDTETTGLDPDLHQIWDVGLIVREHGVDREYQWFLPVDLGKADPLALKIGQFHQRHPDGYDFDADRKGYPIGSSVAGSRPRVTGAKEFCFNFAKLTAGSHLVGAVPSFDEERLRKLLRANKQCPEWHYHLVDIEALVAGKVGASPPWDSKVLSRSVQVDKAKYPEHTALGDARWARDVYDAVMGMP